MQISAVVSKSSKTVQADFTFNLNVLSEFKIHFSAALDKKSVFSLT